MQRMACAHPVHQRGARGAVLPVGVEGGQVPRVKRRIGRGKLAVSMRRERVLGEEQRMKRQRPKQGRIRNDMRAVDKDNCVRLCRIGLRKPVIDVQQRSVREGGVRGEADDRGVERRARDRAGAEGGASR